MNNIKLIGFGHYVPDEIISNDDLSEIMDTSDEWIYTRSGIKRRRVAVKESTCDLAYNACKMALKDASIEANKIDLVLVATITPDNFTPAVSQTLLKRLGIEKCMAFDISAACSGFIYALNVASGLMHCNNFNYALVVGAEVLTKLQDYNDRTASILFGDGAGCCVVKREENKSLFYSMAKYDETNCLISTGIKNVGKLQNSIVGNYYLKMIGQDVFKFAINALNDGITKMLDMSGYSLDEIDYIIPHQANIRIIENVSKKMDIPMEKFILNIEDYGNTSAASIPLALSEAWHKKKIKAGDKIIMVGFGAGLTWGSLFIEL